AISIIALGQTRPASDPVALSYAAQSVAAITGGVKVADVMLTGNATWTVGPDSESGTVTLWALGTGESRMDLALSGGTRSEVRDSSTGVNRGNWRNPTGTTGLSSPHNCLSDAVWFFPALGSFAVPPNVVLSYLGQTTRNSITVQHIQSYVYQPSLSSLTPIFQ